MPPQNVTPATMPFEKYQPWLPLVLTDRTWPNVRVTNVKQPWAHALMHDLYPQLYVQLHACAAFHLRILMQRPQIFKYNGAVRRRRGAAAGGQGAP